MFHHKKQQITPKITPLIAAGIMVFSALSAPATVVGVSIEEQIRQKQAEQQKAQQEADKLGARASDLQTQINTLQEEIAGVQAQIDINTNKYDQLTKQIKEAQKELDEQRDMLSVNIRAMYIEGEISPLEMIASSSNLGDFVEKQEYRDRIKDSISEAMDEIEALKQQLDTQKREVVAILDEQKELRGELDEKNAQAAVKLASVNQSKSAFDKTVSDRAGEVRALLEQQAAAERLRNSWTGGYVTVGGTGGYQWAGAQLVCSGSYCYSPVVDSWGLYARQCTSYVAWKLSSQGYGVRHFNGMGHAFQWPSTTSGYTSQRVGDPRPGDAAVKPATWDNQYGHVMYVESVGSGSIRVSEYNVIPNEYSVRDIPWSEYSNYTFITFPRR